VNLRGWVSIGALTLAAGGAPALSPGATHAAGSFTFSAPALLVSADGKTSSDGATEPRVTVTPDNVPRVISNLGNTAYVWSLTPGADPSASSSWVQGGALANQVAPSIDTDVVSTRTGRIIGVELDFGGINFRTSYSDDSGKTWTQVNGPTGQPGPATGTGYADQDRPYLAVGPDDPTSHLPRVYMLMHNLGSGAASHNMWVATSTDNGTTFGPFIPVTQPGSQAWTDLQCADSGGPSNLFVDQHTGRVFAVWGSRSSVAGGGCGASVTGTFEVNVVAATRVWIASAPAAGAADPTQWSQSLAVDDNATGQIVGMQLSPGAVDAAGNVYILYPESLHAYPDYDGAAIKYVHATETALAANPYGVLGPAAQVWSAPVTVAPSGGPGNLLPHIVAGSGGMIDVAYFHGVAAAPQNPSWLPVAAQTLDALDATPTFVEAPLSSFPAYTNATASQMMGACSSGATAGVENGFLCTRSTDIWGVALDNTGRLVVTWPQDGGEFNNQHGGTWVNVQTDGPAVVVPEAPFPAGLLLAPAVGLGLLYARRRRVATAR